MKPALILMALALLAGCESFEEWHRDNVKEAIREEADRAQIEGLRRDMDHLLRHRR
jgi:hypothetical protein